MGFIIQGQFYEDISTYGCGDDIINMKSNLTKERTMGTYINPGNAAFKRISGPNYIDKTMLIELVNQRIPGEKYLICVSRPRRFGKSYAAKMLDNEYKCTPSYISHKS